MLSFTAASIGIVGGILVPDTGCLLPDYCIKILVSGRNNCSYLEDAVMWPAGQPSLAQPVPGSHGAPGPAGCICLNSAEQEIVDFEVPPAQYDAILDEIELATRQACDAIVPAGWDHNCFIDVGPSASSIGSDHPFQDGLGECIGDCAYTNPPQSGSCPDPNPYECNESGGETSGDGDTETGTETDTGDDGRGSGAYIDCRANACDIDLGFAQMLSRDMHLLVAEGSTLVYDTNVDRFTLRGVVRGSLPAELGLNDGDQLESVNGVTIDDLDSALHAISENDTATELRVRVKRGTQWVDFTYTLVP